MGVITGDAHGAEIPLWRLARRVSSGQWKFPPALYPSILFSGTAGQEESTCRVEQLELMLSPYTMGAAGEGKPPLVPKGSVLARPALSSRSLQELRSGHLPC